MSHGVRRVVALAVIATALVSVKDAAADDVSTGGSSAAFSTLPTGTVPLPPKAKAPATIPAHEKVAGFVVAAAQHARNDYVALVSSAKMGKQFTDGSGFGGERPTAGEACFAQSQDQRRARNTRAEAETAWMPNLQQTIMMSTSYQQGQRPAVEAVHSERIADEGGHVSLETIDAWVDPVTHGVRLIARSSVPLLLVSTIFGGSKIYAAREQQSVHVILVAPKERARAGLDALFAIADGDLFNSACDHLRVTLKTEKGQGETASFITNAELAAPASKDQADSKAHVKAESPFGIGLAGLREGARVRPLHVHASATWTSRDKEPLLTVSAGWDAREQAGF